MCESVWLAKLAENKPRTRRDPGRAVYPAASGKATRAELLAVWFFFPPHMTPLHLLEGGSFTCVCKTLGFLMEVHQNDETRYISENKM